MSKKRNETTEAMQLNSATFFDFRDRLKLLATSIFSYEKLDKYFGFGASRFLENALYMRGRAVFVKDAEIGFLVSNMNPSDKLNVYNLPVQIEASNIDYNKMFEADDVVMIFNNLMQKPTATTIDLFAQRLYETQRTIDVNLQAQKTPVLLQGDEKTILTLRNVYMKYSGNEPVMYGDKNFDLQNKIVSINTTAPYLIKDLTLHKHELINECLTFLGINNANTDKNTVVLSDEINANNELVNYYLNCFYSPRKQAVDLLNKKWGLDVELKVNKNILELLGISEKEIFAEIGKESENGLLHNDNSNDN